MGEVIFGEDIGDVGIPRKAQHDLLVKCSGEKFIFSAFKATIEINCKFAGFKEEGVILLRDRFSIMRPENRVLKSIFSYIF